MALTRITKGVIKPNENYDTHNINSTGIITATGLDVSGNASIGGVLTYEDVTNIDSVGIVTSQTDVHVGAGLSVVGVSTLTDLTVEKSGNLNVNIKSTGGWGALEVGGATAGYIDIKKPFSDDYDLRFMVDGSGTNYITSNAAPLKINAQGATGIELGAYGAPSLQYNNNTKLTTTDKGIKVGTGATIETNGQASFTGIVTAANFTKADGSSLGGVSSDSDENTVGGTGAGANLTGSSDQNTLFGYEAGNDIVSGDYNTCIGHKAGEKLYNGDQNTAVGKNALAFEYSGDSNVAIGYETLLVARSTNHNTTVGRKSGRFLSSGDENILLGSGAGGSTTLSESLTNGSNNVIIGYEALPSASTVSNEITFGNSSSNHLRIPGIGVTFATSGNHISGITTFSESINLPTSNKITFGDDSLWTQYRQGDLLYVKPANTSDTAQLWMESNNQMWIHARASGMFLMASNQNVIDLYGGYGGGIYFKNNGTQYLKLEYANWTFLNNTEVRIPDKLVHAGDTNTMIRFPSDDTISFETSGSERLRIASSGQIGLGGANYGTSGQVLTSNGSGSAPTWQTASGGGGVTSDSEENTVGGTDAGLNLDSDTYRNTLFGFDTGKTINSGDDNTIIGWKAGDAIDSGYKNCAVGSEALPNCNSGHNNVAMGWEAGRSLTSGNNNVCLGPMAGRSLGGGTYNIALGYHALSNVGSPTRCIGIGGDSIFLGGTDVIGIGQGTMMRGGNQIGGIGIGRYAGRNNAGDHNVYIGYEAGHGYGSGSPYSTGNYNTGFGYRSLYNVTTSSSNVAIGASTGDVLTTGNNNIMIGDGADASSATVSNEITLGNSSITKFRIPGLNSFEISDAGVLSGTASAATSANGFRNVTVSTASPSGGSDGDVWIKYS